MRMLVRGMVLVGMFIGQASAASISGLGPGGDWSKANGVSADGTTVVGDVSFGNIQFAYRWTAGSGMQLLDQSWSTAGAVSGDGSIVVGCHGNEAWRWDAQGGAGLGDLPGGPAISRAYGISNDGTIIVGFGAAESSRAEPFRWTAAEGMVSLGAPATGGAAVAQAISGDGSRVAGPAWNSGQEMGFTWTEATGSTFLDNSQSSYPLDLNLDGSVVVGDIVTHDAMGDGRHAFRWTSAQGYQDLGILPGALTSYSVGFGVSADGSVIVGSGASATPLLRAFLWTASAGMIALDDLLISLGADLSGWSSLYEARDISADGRWVVGGGVYQGKYQAFLADLAPGQSPTPAPDTGSSAWFLCLLLGAMHLAWRHSEQLLSPSRIQERAVKSEWVGALVRIQDRN